MCFYCVATGGTVIWVASEAADGVQSREVFTRTAILRPIDLGERIMKCSVAWAVLIGVFVWTNAGHAQQAITIKLKDRGKGESLLVKRNEKTTTKVKVTDGGGNVLVDQKEIKTDIQEYQETTLKREAGKSATKLVRAYGKVRAGKDEQLEDGALQG